MVAYNEGHFRQWLVRDMHHTATRRVTIETRCYLFEIQCWLVSLSTLFCLASRTALASVVAKQKVNTSANSLGTKEIHLLVAVTLVDVVGDESARYNYIVMHNQTNLHALYYPNNIQA